MLGHTRFRLILAAGGLCGRSRADPEDAGLLRMPASKKASQRNPDGEHDRGERDRTRPASPGSRRRRNQASWLFPDDRRSGRVALVRLGKQLPRVLRENGIDEHQLRTYRA
jgi:hypothetical protein